jgi:hypothetical protein
MKATNVQVVHVAFQLRVAEPRKDYERPVYMYLLADRVREAAQTIADVVGREVRVTFPRYATLEEVQRQSGKYFSPNILH